ncbi:PQQ-dependent sugar dehydrogenase [Thalassotalea fusca]
MKQVIILGILSFIFFAAQARDSHPLDVRSLSRTYSSELVAKGVVVPWAMVQLPNNDILVSARSGALRVIRDNQLLPEEVAGLPNIESQGQGGLLDLALHPKFAENHWLYFTYVTKTNVGMNTALMRAKLDIANMLLINQEQLYVADVEAGSSRHFGSRIAFDDQGFVYFSVGDRGERDEFPQDITKDAGKIYRLHDDGSIPKDNPFIQQPKAKPAIYSFGHRNPQGMLFDHESKTLWIHEHGPRGGDEVNLIQEGANYGWPVISYGINYSGTRFTDLTHKAGMEQPALYWDPSIAPSAMIKVTSDKYPKLKGKYLLGSLKFGYIVALDVDGKRITKQTQVLKGLGRVRSLMQGQDGYIYMGLDGGGIRKLVHQ